MTLAFSLGTSLLDNLSYRNLLILIMMILIDQVTIAFCHGIMWEAPIFIIIIIIIIIIIFHRDVY